MTGLAAQIQLDESDFAFNSSGNIDVSGMLVSSRMIIDFLASKASPSEYIGFTMHPSLQEFYDFDAMGRSSESANIGYLKAVSKNSQIAQDEKEQESENIQDAYQDTLDQIEERREEMNEKMRLGNSFDLTREELVSSTKTLKKEYEDKGAEKIAEEEDVSLAVAVGYGQIVDEVDESNGYYDRDLMIEAHGIEAVELYEKKTQEQVENNRERHKNITSDLEAQHHDIVSSADQSEAELEEVHAASDLKEEEWGFSNLDFGEEFSYDATMAETANDQSPTIKPSHDFEVATATPAMDNGNIAIDVEKKQAISLGLS